jgi:hypothetical protein
MISSKTYELVQVLWTDPSFHRIVQAEIQAHPLKNVYDLADRIQTVLEMISPDIPQKFHILTDQERDDLSYILTARYYGLAFRRGHDGKRSV